MIFISFKTVSTDSFTR